MFELPPLPFAKDALAPVMSADTLDTHHGKHHAAYVKKTNALVIESGRHPEALEDVVRGSVQQKDLALFNQAAQAWNHGFFWQCLSPQAQGEPKGALAAAISTHFGSYTSFRQKFLDQGAAHFASGWIWLVRKADGSLALYTAPNAETPIADEAVRPILVCDLWEHAYYLDYKNERPRFLTSFIDRLANWDFAQRQFDAAEKGESGWVYPAPTADWSAAA
ncbi:MAG: superoxide dismutase [Terricaulis silvestris]